jgi:hypothetical protein
MATYQNFTGQAITDYGTSGNNYTFQAGEKRTIMEVLPLPLPNGLVIQDFNGYSPVIFSAVVNSSQTVSLPQIPLNPQGLQNNSTLGGACAYKLKIIGVTGTSTVQINGVGPLLTVPVGITAWERSYNSRIVDNLVIVCSSSSVWIQVEVA